MAVWNLKLGEIDYLGANPILLLDDIFSELDKKTPRDGGGNGQTLSWASGDDNSRY
jgi:hypothetical protein